MEETGPYAGESPYSGEPPWEACYAAVFGVAAAMVEVGPLTMSGRIVASLALALMIPWYFFAVRPLTPSAETTLQPLRGAAALRSVAVLAVLAVLSCVVLTCSVAGWLLAFALCPMCLRNAPGNGGMGLIVALNAYAFAMSFLLAPSLVLAAFGAATFAIALSLVFSRWMGAVMAQNTERGMLLVALSEAREQLFAAHHEAGVQAERQRLAGEIHDTLAQGFTSIVTLIQAASPAVEPGTQPRELLDLALTTARENLAEARALVTTLSPTQLDGGSLADAVTRAAESARLGGEAEIRSEIKGSARSLPTATEVVLLRVAQEALANVRKHSGAERVDVELRYDDDTVTVTVADDGHGFNVDGVSGGFGLRGMRERVRQAGGTITVETAPGAGTVVIAEVPA